MLEAANLDSLTEALRLEETNIDEVCRAELLAASRLSCNPGVAFTIEAPENPGTVRTHAKYFSFVVRALPTTPANSPGKAPSRSAMK